jgi:hypothetical protein
VDFATESTIFFTKTTDSAAESGETTTETGDNERKSITFVTTSVASLPIYGKNESGCARARARLIMSTNDYLPTKDANLAVWLKNYVDACTELQEELGLSPGRLQELQDEVTQYELALDQYTSQIFAARGATATKNLKREQIVRRVRAYTREFKAKPDLSPGDLGLLGVVKTQPGQPLQMVTKLVIAPSADGTNLIKWDRNGNSQTTNFIIECSAGGASDYRFVGSTTKTRFKHENQTPGRPLWYRVISARAGKTSPPCPHVPVYVLPRDEAERKAA